MKNDPNWMSIKERARIPLTLDLYPQTDYIEAENNYEIETNLEKPLNIQNMMVSSPWQRQFILPREIRWMQDHLVEARRLQSLHIDIFHPYTYLTIRCGNKYGKEAKKWHFDGFSLQYNSLPEQNWFWFNKRPMDVGRIFNHLPEKLCGLTHDINQYIQKNIKIEGMGPVLERTWCCIDPYIPHRSPDKIPYDRMMIRVCFTQTEILNSLTTPNPAMPKRPSHKQTKKPILVNWRNNK